MKNKLKTAANIGFLVAGMSGAALAIEAGHDLMRKRDYAGYAVSLGSMAFDAPDTAAFRPIRDEAAQEARQALAGYALLGIAAYGFMRRS